MSFGPVLRFWRPPALSRGPPGVRVGRIPACLVGEGLSGNRFGPSRLPPSARSRAPAHVIGAPVIPPLPLRVPPAYSALNVSSVRDRPRRRRRRRRRPVLRTGRTPDSAVTRRPDRRVLLLLLGASGGPAVRGVRLLSGRSGCGPGPASLRFLRVPGARWLPPLPRRLRPRVPRCLSFPASAAFAEPQSLPRRVGQGRAWTGERCFPRVGASAVACAGFGLSRA